MKQLLEGKVLQMLPVPGGVVAAVLTDVTENEKFVVEYRLINDDINRVQRVSKNVFLLVKFGPGHRAADMQVSNHLTCCSSVLNNGKTFIVEDDGSAKLLSEEGVQEWVGSVKYKGEAPAFTIFDGKNIWASFTRNNTLICLNSDTMREEFRIGGREGDERFEGPSGLFAEENFLYVANKKSHNVWKISTIDFSAEEYLETDSPVYGFVHLENRDIVWLDDGIFEV